MGYDLRQVKRFVKNHYPNDHPLHIISLEKDTIEDPKELLGKVEIWLHLARK